MEMALKTSMAVKIWAFNGINCAGLKHLMMMVIEVWAESQKLSICHRIFPMLTRQWLQQQQIKLPRADNKIHVLLETSGSHVIAQWMMMWRQKFEKLAMM